MKLEKDFDVAKYLHSNTADANGYKEQYYPDLLIKRNLGYLHSRLIAKVISLLPEGYWLNITCGYRALRTNNKVGGSKTSEHLTGQACDVECYSPTGVEENILIKNIVLNNELEFTQMILEKGTKDKPNWIHLSYNVGNLKKQVLVK
jgi:hypothetical protein